MEFDPTTVRLSPHFMLSDFLGNHSVYTRGYPNLLAFDDRELPLKMRNAKALCNELLEPLLAEHGPMSISYGYITPELSDAIVHYQDSRKPSHHMWSLGAAADICIHTWTNDDPDDDSARTAPIALAHEISAKGYPYSRLITYSESPFLCVAVSAAELQAGTARRAFYENQYKGAPKSKPHYKSYATAAAKARAQQQLEQDGLSHGWRGAGYPTYHGGGRRQYQHIRTSKYTMLSDWLFDLQSIANGAPNIPKLADPVLWEAFCEAGDMYDLLIDATGIQRFSIIRAFVSHLNPYFDRNNDWRSGSPSFTVAVPEGHEAARMVGKLRSAGNYAFRANQDNTITVSLS